MHLVLGLDTVHLIAPVETSVTVTLQWDFISTKRVQCSVYLFPSHHASCFPLGLNTITRHSTGPLYTLEECVGQTFVIQCISTIDCSGANFAFYGGTNLTVFGWLLPEISLRMIP